jgi:hypothetical protein
MRLTFFFCIISQLLFAQDWYHDRMHQFIAYDKIPTWMCMISNFQKEGKLHIIDHNKNKGHADFVANELKKGITFAQFKEKTHRYNNREYVPFFIYDLRDQPIVLDGKKCYWAVRLVDYRYEDNPNEMAKTVIKTLKIVKNEIGWLSSTHKRGMILLATSENAKPNQTIAKPLNLEGFQNITLSEMLKLTNAATTKILNEGTAVGYLTLVKTGKERQTPITSKHIAVFEMLPDRVPIANGIVTLEAQTPLSHVNLLAQNRGTLNLYLNSLDDLPELKKHLGKLVKIVCKDQKTTIIPISLEDATMFWKTQLLPKVNIPIPDKSLKYISYFHEGNPSIQTVEYIGAKAANYAMIQKEIPELVRPGYAIPFFFYYDLIESGDAKQAIESFLQDYGE